MLVADSVIVVVVVLLIGIIGFFVMAVALTLRFMGFVFRAITGTGRHDARAVPPVAEQSVACPHRLCGHVNPHGAYYCGRCGRILRPHDDVDAYG